MTIEEEKKLAKIFFNTLIGQDVLKKMMSIKRLENENLMLNSQIKQLKSQQLSCEESQKEFEERKEIVNKAISLFYSKKAPEYLFDITAESGETKAIYSSDLEDILQIPYVDHYNEEFLEVLQDEHDEC